MLVGADADPWAVETHTGQSRRARIRRRSDRPERAARAARGLGNRPRRARRRRRSLPAVLPGGPVEAPRANPVRRSSSARIHGRSLWQSFMQVVERLAPDAVLVENVPDLPSWDDGAVLSGLPAVARGSRLHGRRADPRLLPVRCAAAPLTAAPGRTSNGREMTWPEPSDEFVTLRDAIGDLPPVPGGQRAERLPYRPRPGHRSEFQRRMRRDLPAELAAVDP